MRQLRSKQFWFDAIVFMAILVAGIVTSELTVNLFQQRERDNAQDVLDASGRQLSALIEIRGLQTVGVVEASSWLFTTGADISRQEFANFARSAMLRHQNVLQLEWHPSVTDQQREAWEHATQSSGKRITIKHPLANKLGLIPALKQPSYSPMLYMEPEDPDFLGLDVTAFPTQAQALLLATRENKAIASAAFEYVPLAGEAPAETPEQRLAMVIVAPVYHVPSPTAEQRENQIRGHTIAFSPLRYLFNDLDQMGGLSHVDIQVRDITEPETDEPRWLFRTPTQLHERLTLWHDLSYEQVIKIAGRSWALTVYPTPQFVTFHHSTLLQRVRFAGIVLALMLATLLMLTIRTRNRVRLAEQKLKQIGEHIPVAVFQASASRDGQYGIEYISPQVQGMLGVSADDIMHAEKSWLMMLSEAQQLQIQKQLTHFIEQGLAWDVLITRDDSSPARWLHLLAQPQHQKDDSWRYYGYLEDISEQVQAQQAMQKARALAEESARIKSDFLANMSHEIRTPMNAVIGMTHLALQTDLSPRQRDYLKKIHQSGKHLLQIINDILDFSKIESGKLTIENTAFDVIHVLENVANFIMEKANTKNLEVVFDVDPATPKKLVGDPLRIGQILINFANNAVKFTAQGEIALRIQVVAQSDSDVRLRFSVRDTGIGLSEDQQAQLFQSFHQADSSTTRKYGGTGLGLAICKRLTDLMQGEVGVNSAVGVGSTFWVELTLSKNAEADNAILLAEHLRGQSVLIADDNDSARVVLSEQLRALGFVVHAVSNGNSAIQQIKAADNSATPFAAAFIDWQMGAGLDGVAVIAALHNAKLQHPPRFILVTAFGRDDLFHEAEKFPIDGLLLKPFSASTLYSTVAQALRTDLGREISDTLQTTTARPDLSAFSVLLVEDNEINREVGYELLGATGCHVECAENGEIAIQKLHDASFDAVLMDMQMPVMDGVTATQRLRSEMKFKDLPIIAMTANVLSEDRERCFSAGMNDYIAKPIEPEALWAVLTRWLHVAKNENRSQQTLPSETLSLPNIPGLDCAQGLQRVLGKQTLYLKLLRRFADDSTEVARQLTQALNDQDYAKAERLAHTLKGVAGNIGATVLATQAGDLETAIRTKADETQIQTTLKQVSQIVTELCQCLRQQLPDEAQPSPTLTSQLNTITAPTNELLRWLRQDDARATRCFSQHQTDLKIALPHHYPAIEQAIHDYDFQLAYQRLLHAAKAAGVKISEV